MRGDHLRAGQSPGRGGTDVVGAQVLGDLRPGEPENVGEGHQPQHERRQQQAGEGTVGADGRRDDAPLDAEEELSDEAEDEHRYGDDDQGDDQQGGVEPAALLQTGDDAEADAEDRLDDQCHHRKFDGDGEGLGEDLGDRSAREGQSEVTLEDSAEVEQVLDDERPVQMVLLADGVEHRGIRGLVPRESENRVTWGEEDHRVDEECRSEEDRDQLEETFSEIPPHVSSRPS